VAPAGAIGYLLCDTRFTRTASSPGQRAGGASRRRRRGFSPALRFYRLPRRPVLLGHNTGPSGNLSAGFFGLPSTTPSSLLRERQWRRGRIRTLGPPRAAILLQLRPLVAFDSRGPGYRGLSTRVAGAPFSELGPAVGDQAIGSSHRTPRWRKADSNSQSHPRERVSFGDKPTQIPKAMSWQTNGRRRP
jgi:hypothetical protein